MTNSTKLKQPANAGEPLAEADRRALRRLVREHGEPRALELLELSRGTLARAMAGLGMRKATRAYVRAQLGRQETGSCPGRRSKAKTGAALPGSPRLETEPPCRAAPLPNPLS